MNYKEKDKDRLDDDDTKDLDDDDTKDLDDDYDDGDGEEDEDIDLDDDSEDDDDIDEEDKPVEKKKKLDFDSMEKEEIVKIAKSALAQKNKYKNKAKELIEAKEKEVPTEKKPVSTKQTKKADVPGENMDAERIDFRLDHPDLKKKEVGQIEKFAKANGMSMEESLKEGVIRTYLRERKKKREALEGSPTTRGKGAPLRRRGEKDWSTASSEEIAEHRRKIISRK